MPALSRTSISTAFTAITALTVLGGSVSAQSIDRESAGMHYVIAYPDTIRNAFDSSFPNRMEEAVTLIAYTEAADTVRITSPTGYNAVLQIPAGTARSINLSAAVNPAASTFQPAFSNPSNATFIVEADQPIVLYCHFATRFGGEAFTPIPVDRWGTEYYVSAAPGQVVANLVPGGESDYRVLNGAASPVACVVAAYDHTHVSITPPAGVVLAGNPLLEITLNRGECYTIRGYVDTTTANSGGRQVDISGTRIVASQPIGVVSGNPRTALGYDREIGGLAKSSIRNSAYEWLAPTEQHGTYFVHLPLIVTSRITGAAGEVTSDKRPHDRVLLTATSPGATTAFVRDNGATIRLTPLSSGETDTTRWSEPRLHVYTTDRPAQAFQLPGPALTYIGSAGSAGHEFGSQWNSAGGFMQELVPREQWTTFAPVFAPGIPLNTQHYVAIAADSFSAHSIFNQAGEEGEFNQGNIAGADLVWGVFPIDTGKTCWLEGRNGARFYAVQYGIWRGGYEVWRPGSARKEGGSVELLHPSEYAEVTAIAYGLPLAPRRTPLLAPDSMNLELLSLLHTPERRNVIRAHVSFVNQNANGIGSIFLDAASTTNASMVVTSPSNGITGGETDVTAEIAQVDATKTASGLFVARDRSGRTSTAPFHIDPMLIRLGHSDTLDVGSLAAGKVGTYPMSFYNPNRLPTVVEGVKIGGVT